MAKTVYQKITKNFSVKITETDKGWDKLKREIKKLQGAYTDIGIHEGEYYPDGQNIAEVAWWNEKGVPGLKMIWNIAPRPFVAGWFDGNINQIINTANKLYTQLTQGALTARIALGRLGAFAEGGIKEFMTALREPPNRPSTVKAKGSSNPLIDSGQMRSTVKHKEKFKR